MSDLTRGMSPPIKIIRRIFLVFLVLSPPATAGQQRFLEQPWDVTVVAGDKVRSAN